MAKGIRAVRRRLAGARRDSYRARVPSPVVEAIIPTCNTAPGRLREAIESCLNSVSRVLVIDDGAESPVDLGALERGGRVQTIRQANAGPSAARNAGLDRVRGEFAFLLDDDDVLVGEGLGAMLRLAVSHSAAAVVAAREELRPDGTVSLKPPPHDLADGVIDSPGRVFQPHAVFGGSGVLVGPAALRAGLRFDPDLRIGEDREYLRRVAAVGPIAVSAAVALRVRLHAGSGNLSSQKQFPRRARDLLIILERHMDQQSAPYFREQAIWLLNAMAKTGCSDDPAFLSLREVAASQGWVLPVKTRLRLLWRGLAHGRA
jgi:hypothetical protein